MTGSSVKERWVVLGIVAASVVFYVMPVGGMFLIPLLGNKAAVWKFLLIFLFLSVICSFLLLRNLSRRGAIFRLSVPTVGMTAIGGVSIVLANVAAQGGWQRLSNSVEQFGFVSLLRVIAGFGVLSLAVLFGIAIGFSLAIFAFQSKREGKRGQVHS